jgi:hypothetical protein
MEASISALEEIMEALKTHSTTRLPVDHVVRFRVTKTRKRQAMIFSSPGRGRWFKQIPSGVALFLASLSVVSLGLESRKI